MPKRNGQKKPSLWMVATPIGNLADLSERSITILRQVDGILCEDTRVTQKLKSALQLKAQLIRLDEAKLRSAGAVEQILGRMEAGESFAYVSDAGTPGVSDPGAVLVRAAQENGVVVSLVPGPSAVSAFISVAGFRFTPFSFLGFFPKKEGELKEQLAQLEAAAQLQAVWFESPQRIFQAVEWIQDHAPESRLVVAKELTKVFESIWSGSPEQILKKLQQEQEIDVNTLNGEWVLGVEFQAKSGSADNDEAWQKCLKCLRIAGVSVKDSVKIVGQEFGVARNDAYRFVTEEL